MPYYWAWQTPARSSMVHYPGPMPWCLSGLQDILCFRLCFFDNGYHFAVCRKLQCANLGHSPEIYDKVRGMLMVVVFFFFFSKQASCFFLFPEKIGIHHFHQAFVKFLAVKTQCFCLFRVVLLPCFGFFTLPSSENRHVDPSFRKFILRKLEEDQLEDRCSVSLSWAKGSMWLMAARCTCPILHQYWPAFYVLKYFSAFS